MDQMKRPIVEALQIFQASNPISFHVPGHKNGLLSNLPESVKSSLSFDVTELTNLDDLHAPTGIIAEAEQLLADAYGSDRSFFLVNGSTVGNLAMIRSVCEQGDTLLIQRNAHKSVFHALEFVGAHAVLLTPDWDEQTCTAGAMSASTVEEALERYPEAKGVFVTYPTYYGTSGKELKKIVACTHEYGIPVLADEAHGAHFILGAPFPVSAIQLGVDITVQSAHKTLSAMTQASFLHVKSQLVDSNRLARSLSMLQTSSPSYVLLASLDDARSMIATYSEEDKHAFLGWRERFLTQLRDIATIEVIESDDLLKLLIRQKEASGYTLQCALEQEGVYSELADERQVLFVLPLLTEHTSYPLDRICGAVKLAAQRIQQNNSTSEEPKEPSNEYNKQELIITSSAESQRKTDWIDLQSASDRFIAAAIIPYPPGIPMILSGERLSHYQIEEISHMIKAGAKFQGALRMNQKRTEVEVWTGQGDDFNG